MAKSPTKATLTKRALTRRRNATKRKRWAARRKARILAKGGSEAAAIRLEDDGASTNDAIRRRIQWIGRELQLPADSVAKAMTCHTFKVRDFIKRHKISADWVLFGDMKSLREMLRDRVKPPSTALTTEQFKALYAQLPPYYQESVATMLRGLVRKVPQS